MSGPLPTSSPRRRNGPTIPTTNLPAGGRKGRPPKVPEEYALRKAGTAWWRWAWSLPQAAAWDKGALYACARRAQLEDDLALIDEFDPFDLASVLGLDEEGEQLRELGFVIGRLKSLAGGRLAIVKQMGELDKRLGLDPKALAELRWTIVDDTPKSAAAEPEPEPLADTPAKAPKDGDGLATVHQIPRAV